MEQSCEEEKKNQKGFKLEYTMVILIITIFVSLGLSAHKNLTQTEVDAQTLEKTYKTVSNSPCPQDNEAFKKAFTDKKMTHVETGEILEIHRQCFRVEKALKGLLNKECPQAKTIAEAIIKKAEKSPSYKNLPISDDSRDLERAIEACKDERIKSDIYKNM